MKSIKYCLFASLVLAGGECFAFGNVQNAQVAFVRVDASGLGFVQFTTSTGSGEASCATNNFAFAFDTSTYGGRSTLATVLTAKATGKTITASGTGNSCSTFGTFVIENWSSGQITQ